MRIILVIGMTLAIVLSVVSIAVNMGRQGPAGIQGPIGNTGLTGSQGMPGARGAIGPVGPTGPLAVNGSPCANPTIMNFDAGQGDNIGNADHLICAGN